MRRKLLYFSIFYASGMIFPVAIMDSLNKERGYPILLFLLTLLLFLVASRALIENTNQANNRNRRVLLGFPLGIGIMVIFLFNAGEHPDGLRNREALYEEAKQKVVSEGHVESGYLKIVDVVEKDNSIELITLRDSPIKPGDLYCKRALIKVYNFRDNHSYDEVSPYELIGGIIGYGGSLERPKAATVPRGFNYRNYLYGNGIKEVGTIDSSELEIVGQSLNLFLSFKRRVIINREKYIRSLALERREEAFIKGLLFGIDEGIDDEIYEGFQQVGTAHILAVSGLHIGIIFLAYGWLEKKIGGSYLKALFILFLIIYGTAALWSMSVTRAIVLCLLKIVADSLELNYDRITALAACFILELTINPFSLFSLGLQMSFLAALGIFHLGPFLERKLPNGLSQVLSIQLLLLPYMAFRFGHLPILGILANIPVVFLASPLVILGVTGFIVSMIAGYSPAFLGYLFQGLLNLIVEINELFTLVPKISIEVSPIALVLYYSLIIVIPSEFFQVHILSRKNFLLLRRIGEIACAVFALTIFISYTPFDRASIVFLDVGQGDACHIDWGKADILIDGGGRRDYNLGEKLLKPYFLRNGERNLDFAVATHLDQDHYKGIDELAHCFTIGTIKTQGQAGERIVLGEDRFIDILWPLPEGEQSISLEEKARETHYSNGSLGINENRGNQSIMGSQENESSMVLRIYDRGIVALITGDISSEVESKLVEIYGDKGPLGKKGLLKCHILKIAHHGSRYSTSEEFLREANPLVAVISVGKNNYGHPSPEVIEKLESKGIMIFRTDLDGSVGIIVRSDGFTVCTMIGPGLISFSTI